VDLKVIGEGYNLVSASVVKKAAEDFEACLHRGMKEEEAYEFCCK